MVAKSYNLEFGGYWREPNIGSLPEVSGIYGVYACTFNSQEKTVTLNRLIYIGESANVKSRIASHEKWPKWQQQLRQGEQVCFNAAPISPATDRERSEAAMIHHHKPVCNEEYVNHFPYDATTISTKGRNVLMDSNFTVQRKLAAA